MKKRERLVFWELNEVNFDYIIYYISKGYLPNWKNFLSKNKLINTVTKEESYELLEPWIQWPSIRTGKPYSEHKVFRLGDAVKIKHKQHWEIIEEAGFRVSALSPINAVNKINSSPFWIPDPWTQTKVSGDRRLVDFSKALNQLINDNSNKKIELSSGWVMIKVLMSCLSIRNMFSYIRVLFKAVFQKRHWSKALFFERLLLDFYFSLLRSSESDFSVVFTNVGAHFQHHYLFNSPVYKGNQVNPETYVPKGVDPLFEVLNLYDEFLKNFINLKNTRLMIATGLTQVPYQENKYYWRLKNHKQFLTKIGIKFNDVVPRMTRDFLIKCINQKQALANVEILKSIKSVDGVQIFGEIDLRENSVFVTLTYDKEIKDDFKILYSKSRSIFNFEKDVSFVAIKNGHHTDKGFFIDSWNQTDKEKTPITSIFKKILHHFDIETKK